ncbi:MAG: tetratricopeptide repeat protein, partial [Proteobacteria bacterium]|nr:tetratricopeptide repeat protein [Pseudomonadota bacterium]
MQSLWEKSLITADDVVGARHFRLYESIIEYGEGKLSATERDVVEMRHAKYYATVGLVWVDAAMTTGAPEAWKKLEAARDNLLAARRRLDLDSAAELLLQLTVVLEEALHRQGIVDAHSDLLDQALQVADSVDCPAILVARVKLAKARRQRLGGDLSTAKSLLDSLSVKDQMTTALIAGEQSEIHFQLGHRKLGVQYGDQAADLLDATGIDHLIARGMLIRATNAFRVDHIDLAQEHLERSLATLGPDGDPALRSRLLNNLATLHAHSGRIFRALKWLEKSIELQANLNSVADRAHRFAHLGQLYVTLRKWNEAKPVLHEALRLARQSGVTSHLVFATVQVGWLELDRNNLLVAEERFRVALELATQSGSSWDLFHAQYCVVLLHWLRGDRDSALAAIPRFLQQSGDNPWCLWVVGGLTATTGEFTAAEQYFDRARELGRDLCTMDSKFVPRLYRAFLSLTRAKQEAPGDSRRFAEIGELLLDVCCHPATAGEMPTVPEMSLEIRLAVNLLFEALPKSTKMQVWTQLTARGQSTLFVAQQGKWFQLAGSEPVVLERSPQLCKLLAGLAKDWRTKPLLLD